MTRCEVNGVKQTIEHRMHIDPRSARGLIHGEALTMAISISKLVRNHQRMGIATSRQTVCSLEYELKANLLGRKIDRIALPRLPSDEPFFVD